MSTVAPLPITRGRRWILAIGVPLLLAAAVPMVWLWTHAAVKSLARSDQVGHSVRLSLPVTGRQIRIADSNGNLSFRTAPGHRILVRGQLIGSFTRPALDYRSTGAGLALDPSCPVRFGPCSARFTVTAPAGLPVSVTTSFGNLDARNLRGPIQLADNSGDLAASALTGTIRLNDTFGNLTARHLTGSIQLANSSGDIQASRVTGDTQIRDSFGNINVTGLAAANVTARNNSGDVVLVFAVVPDRVLVTDSFGNVTVELPPGAAYRVHAQTTFGSAVVSVMRSASSAHVITVTDNSGDVTIANGPPAAPVPHLRPARPATAPRPARPARPR